MFSLDCPKVADTAANVGTGLFSDLVGNFHSWRAAVGHRFLRRSNRVMNKGAHLARLFLLNVIQADRSP